MKLSPCYFRRSSGSFMLFTVVVIFFFTIASCSKKEAVVTEEPGPETSDTMFNRLITVLNFGEALPDDMNNTDEQAPIFFSLEQNQAVSVTYKKSARWDLTFSGIYRSFMGGNNSNNAVNFGYQGSGKGGIAIYAKDFDKVTDIPDDSVFRTGSGIIGTDDAGFYGQGVGYYVYDFGGTLYGDGSPQTQHVAYVLQSGRTVVIKTARGNYAKIKMLSIYKDMLDPKQWKRDSPHPYFSFQYVLAKAGSKKFAL